LLNQVFQIAADHIPIVLIAGAMVGFIRCELGALDDV